MLGEALGEIDGLRLGDRLGLFDGLKLGDRDVLGLADGETLGESDGDFEGLREGDRLVLGLTDGDLLGESDGLFDGERDGERLDVDAGNPTAIIQLFPDAHEIFALKFAPVGNVLDSKSLMMSTELTTVVFAPATCDAPVHFTTPQQALPAAFASVTATDVEAVLVAALA